MRNTEVTLRLTGHGDTLMMDDGQEGKSAATHLNTADQVPASEETTASGRVIVSPWRVVLPIFIIFLFMSTKYFGGTLLTSGFFLVFTWAINTQLFPFKKKFREVAINAIFHPDSKIHRFLIAHPTFILWLSYAISSVLSISMMLFMQSLSHIGFVVLLVSALLVNFLYKRSILMAKRPFQDDVAILVREYVVNAVSVLLMLFLFGLVSFVVGDAHRFPLVLDPDIPLYVMETVHHSSYLFQKLLRFYRCMELTMLNLAALNSNFLVVYKVVHAVTAQTLPIFGTVLFLKYFYRSKEEGEFE